MDFKTFAEPLVRFAYPELNKGAAVRQLFIDVTSYDDAECNPIRDIEESTYRGYLKKGRGISRTAGLALKGLDTDKFAAKINDLPTDVINILIDEYSDELPGMSSLNAGDQLAKEFAGILRSAKDGVRSEGKGETTTALEVSPAENAELFLETGGVCPLCGSSIASEGSAKRYKVVCITPLIAKKDYREKRKYEGKVPQMPALGTAEDRIALCLDCASRYENNHEPDEFAALLERKWTLRTRNDLTNKISSLDIEKTLPMLLAQLGQVRDYDELEKLPMKALMVREKIDAAEQLLILKIETLNVSFYNFIRGQGQILEQQGILDFTLLASQVRCCYLKLRKSGLSQEQIFNRVCSWIVSKTGSERTVECEALAAFFVQNCEVFDEIAQ